MLFYRQAFNCNIKLFLFLFVCLFRYFEPGHEYSAVVGGKDAGIPTSATLHWKYITNPLNPLTWRILTSPRVYIQHIVVETLESKTK